MASYSYTAVDPRGSETRGSLDVADQYEALRRIKEMGLFPTKVVNVGPAAAGLKTASRSSPRGIWSLSFAGLGGRVKPTRLAVFTRQLATLVEAGMPLLRGLRILQEQEENRTFSRIIGEICGQIENGDALAEALSSHPKVFNRLYVRLVKAGELSGALETTLARLADFMEKAKKLKGKVKVAMFYPCAVLAVAFAIITVLMAFVVRRFEEVFQGLLEGGPLPAFSRFVFYMSGLLTHQLWL